MPSNVSLPTEFGDSHGDSHPRETPFAFLLEHEGTPEPIFGSGVPIVPALGPAKSGVAVSAPSLSMRDMGRLVCALLGAGVVLFGAWDIAHTAWSALQAASADTKATALAVGPGFAMTDTESAQMSASQEPAAVDTGAAAEETYQLALHIMNPASILIPSIGVQAPIEPVGKTAAGAMGVPSATSKVGWYYTGPKPGQAGNAVMAGHVNGTRASNGVFAALHSVATGDTIVVRGTDHDEVVFRVTRTAVVNADDTESLTEIFKNDGASGLVLITCSGAWDASAKSFDKRVVVFAERVSLP